MWTLPGVKIKHPEVGTWIDDAIGALYPRPRIGDPKVFTVDGDRVAAVIEVEPVAVTPCMMPGGKIYERTSGKTVKVIDPRVLARLVDGGHAAQSAARQAALNATEALWNIPGMKSMNVALAIRSASYADDIASRLFADSTGDTPATADRLHQIIGSRLRAHRYRQGANLTNCTVSQNALVHSTGPFRVGPRATGW